MSKAHGTRAVVKVKDIRLAIADYMRSEGCGCCRNDDAHTEHAAAIAKLLDVPPYSDGSGHDFNQYATDPV